MTLPADDPRHGTLNGYRNHACRCQPCRDANAATMRDYRERNGERLAEPARRYRAAYRERRRDTLARGE